MRALLHELSKTANNGGNELHTANGVWVQKGFPLEPSYEKTLAANYEAAPVLVDFAVNPEAARSLINKWTEDHTKQKIKDLFASGSLDSQTRLVLTSAIYFYGAWQSPFITSRTQAAPFTSHSGATTQANFMNQTSHFGYAETPLAQILEMRYAGTGIAFDVLLPKNVQGLPDLEKTLTNDSLTGWLGNLSDREVQVSIPKFRAESDFSLGKTLSTMGMPTAFTGRADFSGISAKGGLQVGEVVHKAFVDVTEQGTEAAAATGIAVTMAAVLVPRPPLVFRADHPFMFVIRDVHSGTILFIGRLMSPK
ncbi:MAG: serpin family protein [Bryobacterales bacterium]|nr:serpin family protein [Bryobacterales bacterium]MBV9402011.1 serpin family protein [Bryobacterales bacterium]